MSALDKKVVPTSKELSTVSMPIKQGRGRYSETAELCGKTTMGSRKSLMVAYPSRDAEAR